jgi:hypothetical protein
LYTKHLSYKLLPIFPHSKKTFPITQEGQL